MGENELSLQWRTHSTVKREPPSSNGGWKEGSKKGLSLFVQQHLWGKIIPSSASTKKSFTIPSATTWTRVQSWPNSWGLGTILSTVTPMGSFSKLFI